MQLLINFFIKRTIDEFFPRHEKHIAFHQKYPEKFAPDESASHAALPVYFSNVCLRFLPVLDVVIHRFIELPIQHVHQILDVILDHLSILYKFHGEILNPKHI